MALHILKKSERENLFTLFTELKKCSDQYPEGTTEVMTALRCLKAVHSNAIEDKRVDRVFLQILLHGAGIPDKSKISTRYQKAKFEINGQEEMLRWLESLANDKSELSLSLLLEMHKRVFGKSWPDGSGKFRQSEVAIQGMQHLPPHHSKIQEYLHQSFLTINERLKPIQELNRDSFFEVLRISADVHYAVAHIHPFSDGNGRIARAVGDYVLLLKGMFYDVIMSDYRDFYLDAMEECSATDSTPLYHFIEYSYLETLQRISGFFKLVAENETSSPLRS
ncbi:hypothetical protein BVX98_06990 [bacterium F11]|nr:hypothetical protein BVX98_06990 [bacterium F11]